MNAQVMDLLGKALSAGILVSLCSLIGVLIASGRAKRAQENAARITADGNKDIKIVDGTLILRTEEIRAQTSFEERILKVTESQDKKILQLEGRVEQQDRALDEEIRQRRALESQLHDANLIIKGLQAQINEFEKLVAILRDENMKRQQDYEETITHLQNELVDKQAALNVAMERIRLLESGVIA